MRAKARWYWVRVSLNKAELLDALGLPRYPADARALYLWLLSGRHLNHYSAIPGLFEAHKEALRNDCRWPGAAFDAAFQRLIELGAVVADWQAPLVCLPAEMHQHLPTNPSHLVGWAGYWAGLPACSLREQAAEEVTFHLRRAGRDTDRAWASSFRQWAEVTRAGGEASIFELWDLDAAAERALAAQPLPEAPPQAIAQPVRQAARQPPELAGARPVHRLLPDSGRSSEEPVLQAVTISAKSGRSDKDLDLKSLDPEDQDFPPTPQRGAGLSLPGRARAQGTAGAAGPGLERRRVPRAAGAEGDQDFASQALSALQVSAMGTFVAQLCEPPGGGPAALSEKDAKRWLQALTNYADEYSIDRGELVARLQILGHFLAQGNAGWLRGNSAGVLGTLGLQALISGNNFKRCIEEALNWRRSRPRSLSRRSGAVETLDAGPEE